MVNMASSFSNLPVFKNILTRFSNPILGILVGAIITALVQSSAATVGILQAISNTGIITYSTTIPIILGQNIGTCFTSLLSSIGTSKNAKRVAFIHLLFNLIGTIIFVIFIYTYQKFIGFSFWNKTIDMGGIANFHLIFNVVCTIIFLPCIGLLEKLAMIFVKEKEENEEIESDYLEILDILDERITSIPSVSISNSKKVISTMTLVAIKNFNKTKELLDNFSDKKLDRIQELEDVIDKIDVTLTNFLVKIDNLDLTEQENISVNTLLKVESEWEKIGDYIYKSSKLIESMNNKELSFSKTAIKQLKFLEELVSDILDKVVNLPKNENIRVEVQSLKEISDMYIEQFKKEHIDRLKKSKCSVESGIYFIEILNTYEMIIVHCINISLESVNYKTDNEFVTKHEYLNNLYIEKEKNIKKKYDTLSKKYKELLTKYYSMD